MTGLGRNRTHRGWSHARAEPYTTGVLAGWTPPACQAWASDMVSALRALLGARPGSLHHVTDGHVVVSDQHRRGEAAGTPLVETWASIVGERLVAHVAAAAAVDGAILHSAKTATATAALRHRLLATCLVLGGFVEPLRTGARAWIVPELKRTSPARPFTVAGPVPLPQKALIVLHDPLDVASVVLPDLSKDGVTGSVPAWAMEPDAAAHPESALSRVFHANLVPIAGVPATADALHFTAGVVEAFMQLLRGTAASLFSPTTALPRPIAHPSRAAHPARLTRCCRQRGWGPNRPSRSRSAACQ